MLFEVIAEDGRSVGVDAADWMMALVRGVDKLGDRVTGFSCSTADNGEVTVEDHGTGHHWVVRPRNPGSVVPAAARTQGPTPPPPTLRETAGPTPRRLMEPHRRAWRSVPPRPLWAPDAAPRSEPPEANRDPRSRPPPNLAETLFESASTIQDQATLESACLLTLDHALAVVPAEAGSVLQAVEVEQKLIFAAVRGDSADALRGKSVPWGTGIVGAATVGGVPIVVRDAHADPRHDGSFDAETGFVTKGLLAVPIRSESGFYGVIEIINPRGADGFQPWHVDAVESLAKALADRLSGRSE